MEITYFKNVPNQEVKKKTLQDYVVEYQQSGDEQLFGLILYKLKNTFNYYLYQKTNYCDKPELLALYEDKLMECLKNYDATANVKFITYYCRCLDHALINFIKSLKQPLISLDYEYECNSDNGDSVRDLKDSIECVDTELLDSDTQLFLEQLKSVLDENEYKVCRVIITENHNLTKTEIAQAIGLTPMAILNILGRLRKKMTSLDLCRNF